MRRLSKPLPSGLLADSKHGSDLCPGATVRARLRDLIGEPEVAGGDGMQRLADGSQVLSTGLG